MPDNLPSMILSGLFLAVGLLGMIRILWKKLAPVKTVTAEVVDKGLEKVLSKTGEYGSSARYYIVFAAEGKKLSFYVNQFSYNGYRKGEKGKLTYKGDRIIDFS